MNEIDAAITDLLERARPARPVARDDWEDVLRRSRRGRRRRLPVPTRGLLLAAAVIVGLAAVAQAETGVFRFITDHGPSHPGLARHNRRLESIKSALQFGILPGLPGGTPVGIRAVAWTSRARMAQAFGGGGGRYPAAAGVVVVRGPFSIPLYLQGCAEIPYACPAPIGNWAWLAYSVLPSPRTGPMSRVPNVRLLKAAPSGTPLPQLGRLGQVTEERLPPLGASTAEHQHQGTITLVTRSGSSLTEVRVHCGYTAGGYTTPLCTALATYTTYLRVAHPNDPLPATGSWTRVSGTLGGWRGNLVITPARLTRAPTPLRAALTNAIADTAGTPIRTVPAALPCVVNPIPCFQPHPATIHTVVAALNRHGVGLREIPAGSVPARYRGLIPARLHIVGAATNAGTPAVATRGYVLSMVLDHPAAFSIRQPFEKLLGNDWGVFLEDNALTLVHPYFTHGFRTASRTTRRRGTGRP